jgi:hypothetical protein
LDELCDRLATLFEREMAGLGVDDPWRVRDDYISIVLNRDAGNIEEFVRTHLVAEASPEQRTGLLKLLELQRHAMLMFTSCGWFFDDINRLEPVQILEYAARAVQLAREISGEDYEADLIRTLSHAPSNDPELKDGAQVYHSSVKPNAFDSMRVSGHYAILALGGAFAGEEQIGSYSVSCTEPRKIEAQGRKLVHGTLETASRITLEEDEFFFVALDSGSLDLRVSVFDRSESDRISGESESAFAEEDWKKLNDLIEGGSRVYQLMDLGRDYQLRVLEHVISTMISELDAGHQHFLEQYSEAIQVMKRFEVRLPAALETLFNAAQSEKALRTLESAKFDRRSVKTLKEDLKPVIEDDSRAAITAAASEKIERMLGELVSRPEDQALARRLISAFKLFVDELGLDLDLWTSQNRYMEFIKHEEASLSAHPSNETDASSMRIKSLSKLAKYLMVRAPLQETI